MIMGIISGAGLPAVRKKMAIDLSKSGTSYLCNMSSLRMALRKALAAAIDRHRNGTRARCGLLQGTNDNYATDLVRNLIEASAQATSSDPDGPHKTHHRVIADHLRSTSFLIADGVLPSKDGRGYVLRRIMRRAMRHAHLIGAADPLMHRWCRLWSSKWALPILNWCRRNR